MILVNGCWILITGNVEFVLPSIYICFNYLVFRTVLVLYSHFGSRLLWVTIHSAIASTLALSFFSVFSANANTFRSAVLFNNPNQLAYFTLITATMVAFGGRRVDIDARVQMAFYLAATYLLAVANSKAGLLGFVVLLVVVLFSRPSVAVAVALVALLTLELAGPASLLVENVDTRLSVVQADDTFASRGYGLLTDFPEHIVLGAGDADFFRFGSDREIHSTWGTIVFAYGIPGALLFGSLLIRLFQVTGVGGAMFFLPTALYGLAHNGIRFTLFWVMLAFMLATGFETAHVESDRMPSDRLRRDLAMPMGETTEP
jgi:hypothetical protein